MRDHTSDSQLNSLVETIEFLEIENKQLRARVAELEKSLKSIVTIVEDEAKDAIFLNDNEWTAIEKAKSLLK